MFTLHCRYVKSLFSICSRPRPCPLPPAHCEISRSSKGVSFMNIPHEADSSGMIAGCGKDRRMCSWLAQVADKWQVLKSERALVCRVSSKDLGAGRSGVLKDVLLSLVLRVFCRDFFTALRWLPSLAGFLILI